MSEDLLLSIDKISLEPSSTYHSYFRARALKLKTAYEEGRLDQKMASTIPHDLVASEQFQTLISIQLPTIRDSLIDILLSKNSAQFFWSLYCSPSSGYHSVLTQLLPSLESIVHIIRGGPNIYKLNGWVVHVLVGYTFVAEYIPQGELPLFFDWPEKAKIFVHDTLKRIYNSLNHIDKLILHTAMLGHDIGVAININDHDTLGLPLVPSFLTQLGFKGETWSSITNEIPLQDFIWAIQAIIRFHTFINRVGVEFSISRSENELKEILKTTTANNWRSSFIQNSFARILLLVGTSDLVAVDDALLTNRKILGLEKGFELLLSLLDTKTVSRDPGAGGFERFKAFLDDNNWEVSRVELDDYLSSHGYLPSVFWEKFYRIQEFNFTLSLVQYLPTVLDTLIVFLVMFYFIDECLIGDATDYETVCIDFDHRLTPGFLYAQLLTSTDVESILESMTSKTKYYWRKGELELIFRTNGDRHIVLINMVNGDNG